MRQNLPNDHGLSAQIQGMSDLLPVDNGSPSLTEAQYDALEAGIARGESAIVSAPTSTGKTLIGLWTIASSIEQGGRAVYLVSHRALARQKFDEIKAVFGQSLLAGDLASLVIATGDGVENGLGAAITNPFESTVLVATYEKFLFSLSSNGPPRDLTDVTIVCDEIQLMDDAARGRDVELLLTLLKRAQWKQLVALSAVLYPDDAQELADWLEIDLVRNPSREKSITIEARTNGKYAWIKADVGQSVTPISEERQTKSLDTLQIVKELVGTTQRKPVIVFCMRVDDTYALSRSWVQATPATLNITAPAGADVSSDLVQCLNSRAAYHNAELSEDERAIVEERLKSGTVDVVFATSTLAAGVNFPLGSAVFHEWQRYNFDRGIREPLPRPEFHNMAGRVGRIGQVASEGLVVCVARNIAEMRAVTGLMDLTQQNRLTSRITPDDFGRLLLHLFAGKICESRVGAYEILSSTLSASRELQRNASGLSSWQAKAQAEVDQLIAQDCLFETSVVRATLFGITVAHTGLKPDTVLWMMENLLREADALKSLLPNDEDDLLFILSHAALCSPEFTSQGGRQTRYLPWRLDAKGLAPNSWARRLEGNLFVRPWHIEKGAANGALLIVELCTGKSRSQVETLVPGMRIGVLQGLAHEVAWVLTGIAEAISQLTAPSLDEMELPALLRADLSALPALRSLARTIRRVALRISAGLPSDVLWMLQLDRAGPRPKLNRTEILALRDAGLSSPIDLMRGDDPIDTKRRLALSTIGFTDPSASNSIRRAARAWKVRERQRCRTVHERVLARAGGGTLVNELYTVRGGALEKVLEKAFELINLGFTKLDVPGTQAHPDYAISVPSLPEIIVEVKTRQDDDNLVGLNLATEVLAAAARLGRANDHCLTICSPAHDPIIPGQIEACSNLTVVDICDLTDAILRVLTRRLSNQDFHNWLTTPGIAQMADLPSG